MMYGSIYQEVTEIIFKISPVRSPAHLPRGVFSSLPQNLVHDEVSGLSSVAAQMPPPGAGTIPEGGPLAPPPERPAPIKNEGPKVGRNEPCPCGSGKKYKKCHGR